MKILLALLTAIVLTVNVQAQTTEPRPNDVLQLSEAQIAQIEVVGNKMTQIAKEIMESKNLSQNQKEEQLKSLQAQMKVEIEKLLTPEQKAKLPSVIK